MKTYHYRNLKSNEHLQNVLDFIISNPLCTNWDIMKSTGSTRAKDDVNEINHNFKNMELDLKIVVVPTRKPDGKILNQWLLISDLGIENAKEHSKEMLKVCKHAKSMLKKLCEQRFDKMLNETKQLKKT